MQKGYLKFIFLFSQSLFTLALTGLLWGCVSGAKRDGIAFERRWVRDSVEQNYHGNFNNMVFQPIVFDELVVAGNNVDGLVAYSKFLGSKKWTFKTPGGVANPGLVVGNYIFFSTYNGKAIALNAHTGKIFWSTIIDYPTTKKFLFENGRLYIHTQNDQILCLDASSGERVWTYKHSGRSKTQISGSNPPLMLGALVISGFSDGSIVALEKYNGKERWERRLNYNNRFRDLNALSVYDTDKILVGSYEDKVYALKGVNGAIIWKKEIQVTSNFVHLANKNICAGTLNNKIQCIDPKNKGEKTQTFNTDSTVELMNVSGELLFYGLADGGVVGLNTKTKKSYKYSSFSGVSAVPVVEPKSKNLYFSTNRGNIYSLNYYF